MVNLTASGDTIKFEFENSPHYLYNGTIEVPKNSLSMVMDDSEMVTFKKSASNDIFVSIRYSELGKTKNEMLSWYKDNMVKDYVDEGEVDEQIEEATQNYFDGAEYDSNSKRINFKHGSTIKGYIDASDFVIDGMVDDVEIENGYLVITFNTDSGKQPISIPLSDIFNPNDYYNKTAIDNIVSGINADIAEKLSVSDFNTYSGAVDTAINSKASQSDLSALSGTVTAHTANTDVHVTAQDKSNWNAKSDFSGSYNDLTDKPTIPTVPTSNTAFTNDAGYITSGDAQTQIDNSISGKVDTSVFTEKERVVATALNDLNDSKVDTSTFNTFSGNVETALSAKQDVLSAGTNITISGNVISSEGGNNVVTLTQAEYDALETKDPDAFYIISDAQGIDLSQYWTSAETTSAITSAVSGKVDTSTFNTYSGSVETALSGKQDTLSAGTGINITDNVISATGGGGGGKAVSAGTNISITTGETADTINCTLPLSGKGGNNIVIGDYNNTRTNGYFCLSLGYNTIQTHSESSIALGEGNNINVGSSSKGMICAGGFNSVTNNRECAFGQYNVSNKNNTDSGNTLFSVGNGTNNNARHNAFEIRKNGDIYISSGGTDILLQDHLGGGGGASYSAGTGIDITNNVISVSGVVETSAITTAITSSSTDAQVPSAKAVYDTLGDIETLLSQI